MVGDQETVFCWVLVFLSLAQWRLIFFCVDWWCWSHGLFLCLFASFNLHLHLKRAWHENLSLGTYETWATTKGTGTVSTNLQHEGILWNSVTFGSFATVGRDLEEGK